MRRNGVGLRLYFFVALGACLTAVASFFFFCAPSFFTVFCVACFLVAFGDLSPIIVTSLTFANTRNVSCSIVAIYDACHAVRINNLGLRGSEGEQGQTFAQDNTHFIADKETPQFELPSASRTPSVSAGLILRLLGSRTYVWGSGCNLNCLSALLFFTAKRLQRLRRFSPIEKPLPRPS